MFFLSRPPGSLDDTVFVAMLSKFRARTGHMDTIFSPVTLTVYYRFAGTSWKYLGQVFMSRSPGQPQGHGIKNLGHASVNKYTHSGVVCLRLEDNLVYTVVVVVCNFFRAIFHCICDHCTTAV